MSRTALPAAALGLPATTRRAGLAVIELEGSELADAPVVLVPGYTGSKEDFGPVLAPLAAAGHQVIAVDLPGQFESPGPQEAASFGTEAQASALLALLDELGPAHLVGHSFGGLVCRAAAIRRPDAVRSLVLLCSGPAALPAPRRADTELLVEGAPGLTMEQVWAVVTTYWTARGAEPPGDFAATRWLASSVHGLVGMGRAVLDEPDRVTELRGTGVPVLVVTGERDDAWAPAVQAEMARRLGTEQVIVPGAAHSPAIEAPAELTAVLCRWLAGVRRPMS
jgi:pimeloyl-ACP methyl ester carboxylesterase